MSDRPDTATDVTSEEMLSGLFAQLVLQQANMATMFLGKVTHPETGEVIKDIDAARLFIDQLAMLETKTKGNLTKDEAGLLKQTLMSLRLAFVEAVESPEAKPQSAPAAPTPTPGPSAAPAGATQPDTPPQPTSAGEEHPKKFSKKY